MVRAGSVPVHFLQKYKIRIRIPYNPSRTTDRSGHTILILSPGRLAAIHEETVLRAVCTETYVISHDQVGFFLRKNFCCDRTSGIRIFTDSTALVHFQDQFVRKSVIRSIHIDNISSQDQQ